MSAILLSGEDIVCLALRGWDTPWKNNQQVMSLIARSNRVLYVDPPRAFRESLASVQADGEDRQTVKRIGTGLFIYREPWFLSRFRHTRRGSYLLNGLTQMGRMAHVRRVCQQLGFRSPILWVYDPMLAFAVGTFREKLVVYHVIDNYDEYFHADAPRLRTLMAKNHRVMLDRAHLVFAVSEALYRRCLEFNPNSHLVPNGVNYPRFEEAVRSDRVPEDVGGIPHPIVGYIGVIQPRMDFHLLQQMATIRPDWSFMLVGPTEHLDQRADFNALARRQNVYYLGPKPVEQVPLYIKTCDVGILPYRLDSISPYSDSLKLYEYLACGRPIVSSDMPSSRRFAPLVRIATDLPGFIEEIEMSLAEDGTLRTKRMALAERHSWDRRVWAMREFAAAALVRN